MREAAGPVHLWRDPDESTPEGRSWNGALDSRGHDRCHAHGLRQHSPNDVGCAPVRIIRQPSTSVAEIASSTNIVVAAAFSDVAPNILVLTPIFFPVIHKLGIDPVAYSASS